MNDYFKCGFEKLASPLLIEQSGSTGSGVEDWHSLREERGQRQALLEALSKKKPQEQPSPDRMVEEEGPFRSTTDIPMGETR